MRSALAMPPPGFDDLTPDEKLDYVQALWDRVADSPENLPAPEWQKQLVRERLSAHERGEGSTVPWSTVRQEAEELLRKPPK